VTTLAEKYKISLEIIGTDDNVSQDAFCVKLSDIEIVRLGLENKHSAFGNFQEDNESIIISLFSSCNKNCNNLLFLPGPALEIFLSWRHFVICLRHSVRSFVSTHGSKTAPKPSE